MKVWTKVEFLWDAEKGQYVQDVAASHSFDYEGPVALCGGGKGGSVSAPAPDPQIGEAALKNAEVGQEWLDFAKEQFAVGNVRQDAMDELTKAVTDQQLVTQENTNQWAQEDRQRTKDVFQPLQDQFINTAQNYDSPEKQAEAAAQAKADVMKSADTQNQVQQRTMASMGINPASGRYAGITRANDTNTALAAAGAQNAARTQVKDKALALKADAINMGNGLASSTASAYGLGLNAGNSAVGNTATAQNSYYQNNNVMSQGFGGAMQGYANQGNIMNNLYGNQVNAWSAQQQANATSAAGLGSMLGTVSGAGLMVY